MCPGRKRATLSWSWCGRLVLEKWFLIMISWSETGSQRKCAYWVHFVVVIGKLSLNTVTPIIPVTNCENSLALNLHVAPLKETAKRVAFSASSLRCFSRQLLDVVVALKCRSSEGSRGAFWGAWIFKITDLRAFVPYWDITICSCVGSVVYEGRPLVWLQIALF